MTSRIPLGVAIPQTFLGRRVEPKSIREYLERAEALGFESAWVVEQILGGIPSLEPVALLTWAAGLTARLRLGSAVLLSAIRSPVHLAKSLATLDHLSQGRLIVGLGLGGNPGVYPAYGITADRRAARFVEAIEVMRRLWTEPRVTFAGQFWTLENARMEPKPVQQPHPPVWFGAHHPHALRRAVERGAGFIGAGSITTSAFADEVRVIRKLLAEVGRAPETFGIGKRVYIAINADRQRASARLAEWFGAFYGKPELAEQVSVWGGPDECIEGLREVVAGGARFLMLNPVFDEHQQLERIAADIAPRLEA
jgi:probable F420-dependent oxidoreductase